ncbi:hypothetical protein ACWXWU_14960 [Shewanella sp. A14]
MTFPWARILLMLVIVGLCSIFLINSHALILSPSHWLPAHLTSSLSDSCIVTTSPHLVNCNADSKGNTQLNAFTTSSVSGAVTQQTSSFVLYNQLINVKASLLGYVGDDDFGRQISQSNPNDVHYVPTYSARYVNLAQHQPDEVSPHYSLAFEFFSPPVPSLTIGYQVNFSPQLDWILSASSAPSRISAWKESNQLFVHAHTC